ncbi:disease resistance protein RPM1-like isoform X2 [Quercus robur]|uniref:disease resistance protein RPM1-like isoform X2 n=1 Tax=Quercus robur TaxID=38942 RepID=UPI0021618790|nr:disease resistance protein RPM1-like isoform X2 [Quercus robur]XP_050251608.1 disease resistance protein RPM1-like isoform X2 [Quercus robur]XP_050251609.1 disease resistance protein RPM1-like isoform X2 [Quercus robur]XP_050251610.1 disease resistance protein RPM1-like isoform X2 [Quercus robur]
MDQAVVELLTENIISILSNEASLLWGVRDAIEDIKDELISMRSFLVDADRKGVGSEGEKTWVTNVRDMAYDVEDIIDYFMYHMNRQRIGGRSSWILHHTIYFPKNLWVRRKTATKIQKINGKIKGAIPQRNQRYGIDRIEGTSSKDNQKWVKRHAESSLFFEEDELVGIEKKRQLIMDWLMDGEPHLTVISIVGMGGSGKTTLAANTYNNDDVKKHFDCCAWITISQAYELEDVLRSLIMEFHESRKETNPADLNSMNYRLLIKTLVNYLEKKRYLLVLDDVWDTNLLDEVKVSLRDSCFGSRIILTTRKEDDVACHQMGGKHHIHKMELLLTEEAWELFCKKAFSSSPNGSCPPELKSFAQELVRKCDGLPLAIAALGSLMYSKNMSEWNEIYNSLNWSLCKNPKLEAVKSILLLSFNDLPYQLKHCFLYCSLFPEDHEIRRKRLIKLWMAEGFVEQDKRSMPEEVAESYLLELIFRSMLQVVRRNEFGRPKRCKMHDILRELALSISEREKIGVVHVGREEMTECEARRISIHKTDGEVKSFTSMPKLRSFLVFNKMLKTLPFGSKMLRVLDLEDAPIDDLPDELFKLFNLRYLNLRGTLVKELPKSVGRLQNLQTLDIRDTKVEILPCEIGELQNLRHLILHQYTGNWNDFKFVIGPRAPSNICRLKNLQVVTYLEIKGDLLKQIPSMTQLTMIVLSNVKAADEMDLCDSIHNMKLMRCLGIVVTNAEETLRMDALSSPPTNLQKLVLAGKLEKVPKWFHSLQSLTALALHWSRLEEDLLPHIAALPHLGHLELSNAYVGKQLCFSTGFLKLTAFNIRNLPQLNEIIIEKGVMPNLKSLGIYSCMELKAAPKGIENLQNLQLLHLQSVSMELQNRIREVDSPKVQHIPAIYISK